MEGLGTLLLFAAAFYALMRFTCGADLVHGASERNANGNDPRDTDPVCGKTVEIRGEYATMHHGKVYRFCSRKCLDAFESHPEQYLSPTDRYAGPDPSRGDYR